MTQEKVTTLNHSRSNQRKPLTPLDSHQRGGGSIFASAGFPTREPHRNAIGSRSIAKSKSRSIWTKRKTTIRRKKCRFHQSKRPVATRSFWRSHAQNGVYKCLPVFKWSPHSWDESGGFCRWTPVKSGTSRLKETPRRSTLTSWGGERLRSFFQWSGSRLRPDFSFPLWVWCELVSVV